MRLSAAPSSAPRSVGGYALLRTLGVGGMSEVFLGYDPHALRSAAVKVLADHLAGNQQFVNRFYREALLTRGLDHPALVRGLAHGFDPAANAHYLILELVDGPTAQAVLERGGRFPVGVAVRIALDVAAALDHLHGKHLVHRDVKPENVLLQPAPPAKLADFGLAKRVQGDGHLTAANEGFGTPHYMPFEQAVNAAFADARSDVFALGATLYHLLTGRVPFPDAEADPTAPRPPLVPPHELVSEVPPALDPVLGRMLAADPRARFPAAADAAAALERAGPACSADEYTAFVTQAAAEVGDTRGEQPTRYAPRNTA